MNKQILEEIDKMKSLSISINKMAERISAKFAIPAVIAKDWIVTAAFAESLGIHLSDL